MDDLMTRIVEGLLGRADGPLHFRLFLQPLMAILLALRDGRADAREGRPPYFWALFSQPEHRRELLHHGWQSIGKVFILAIILDVVYQFIVLHRVRLVWALVTAVLLAIIPYVLLRGPVNRLMSAGHKDGQPPQDASG